ncbi:Sporulation initiation inhibitor protein soj [Thalassovita autumnalis]|jgi:chromosome partitioning protein|uniref:Sporulation initiation inhibitor protein soj n=1 Tax=Thalassovita autumnalis TaxID=2072972 RepID=A0A0P1FNR3_9RHOB|nr:AAA family ATPase [Thalassovita autumnalis]MEC7962161.1 AAA family ATPase [Pseudomonadota bacterium]MEC8572464.1 AAA family ATPase [Pseudomonadota bacterium]CUH70116.1 Sporulation initiation inhibitor protein soj [Thalassovita autumnalis]CUH73249.1 Sporulation initiation inhibitor protein soj [Thalassovita autumnalis]
MAETDFPITLDEIEALASRADIVIDRLRERLFAPGTEKRLDVRFNVRTAGEMVGRTEKAIRDAEADGRLPEPEKDPTTGRRTGYSLAEINRMRDVFGTLPHRAASDPATVLAVQNFKGGVGKSTVTVHLAQYLALKGYRVCVIDCDSQASTTSMFGLNPDVDVNENEDTLYPFFQHGGPASLHYALRATYWPGVALIPANLGLYDAEYEFAARIMREEGFVLDRLRAGIESISDQFDVILLDPPPALGMISLSVLRAANALVIPAPPNNIDFGSTAHFLRMMSATLHELAEHGGARGYHFVKVLATKMNDQKGAHQVIKRMMDAVFPQDMLQAVLKDSAEIDNAAANLQSVYEITGAAARTETHKRCRTYLDAVGREIEVLIRKTWPSHHAALRKEGIL